jgi:HK97 family phage major capsid protein
MSQQHTSETVIHVSGEDLKSLGLEDGKMRVGAYAIRFSDASEKDLTGEYFTKSTNFGNKNGDGAIAMFNHGQPIRSGLEPFADLAFGEVKTKVDEFGLFAETVLDVSDKYQKAIADMCAAGKLRWSSGSASHVVKKSKEGEIKRWPIVEFSFTPTPAEPRLPAIMPMKSLPISDEAVAEISKAIGIETKEDDKTVKVEITVKTAPVDNGERASAQAQPRITMSDKTPEQLAEEQKNAINAAVKSRGDEVNEILAVATRFNCVQKAQEFIKDGKSLGDFNKHLLNDHLKAGKPVDFDAGRIGMSDKEAGQFSVLKAISEMAKNGRLSGLEKEASDAAMKLGGHDIKGLGFVIPDDVLRAPVSLRGHAVKTNTIGSNPNGGYLMQPELGPLIELLRNKPRVVEAGATTLSGLVGDVYLPRQNGASTAYWVSENGALTDSNATFEQVKLTPKRLGASIPYSNSFLAQSSVDAESVIRNDAVMVLALAKDLAALHGTGVNGQPLGLQNTPNVDASVTYSGAATWAKVIASETAVTTNNADIGNMAFMLSAAAVGKWKGIARASNYPVYLIGDDMTANGYKVFRTNQISGDVSFFGVWSQLYLASWAGLRVIIDPYTDAKSDLVHVTFNELCDIAVRQPKAFTVSTDTAAA